MLCYGGGDVQRPSAYTDEHGGTTGADRESEKK